MGLNVSLGSVKGLPEVSLNSTAHILWVVEIGRHHAHGVLEVDCVVKSGALLHFVALSARPDVNVVTQVKDKHIVFAELLGGDGNWENSRISFSLNAQKFGYEDFWDNVLETRAKPTLEVLDTTLEVLEEELGLIVHELQVVMGGHFEKV